VEEVLLDVSVDQRMKVSKANTVPLLYASILGKNNQRSQALQYTFEDQFIFDIFEINLNKLLLYQLVEAQNMFIFLRFLQLLLRLLQDIFQEMSRILSHRILLMLAIEYNAVGDEFHINCAASFKYLFF